MSRNLERLVQKAKAQRPRPAATKTIPADALPICAETDWDRSKQVDRLIASGKLAETDRPRCVAWTEFISGHGPLNPEQLALVRAQAAIAKETVPDVAAAFALSTARLLECLNPEDENAISRSL